MKSDALAVKALHVQPPRPNECNYWVTESLLAGEYLIDKYGASRQKLRDYLDCGITYFVDLTHPGEKEDYRGMLQEEAAQINLSQQVQYKKCPIPDFGIPSKELMKHILDTIDEAI